MKKIFIAILFVQVFCAGACLAARTNLPPAQATTLSINPTNHLVTWPVDFVASNGLASVNPAVCIYDMGFTNWGTSDGGTWTNADGWESTAVVTNGFCDLASNSLLSPWITGRGLSGISFAWSNLYMMSGAAEYTTNGTDWVILSDFTNIRLPLSIYRLRITAKSVTPPIGDPFALLTHVQVFGFQFPGRVGMTNDHAGIVIRVDNPSTPRDAVNLQTLDSRLAGWDSTPVSWANYPAVSVLDLAGKPLKFDPRYQVQVSNDTWCLSFAGQSVFDIIGGGTVTPHIAYFAISSTQATARVSGVVGWRPYPEWSSDLTTNAWTRLATNEFASTYPNLTNGYYVLQFAPVTNSPAYYRITAIGEGSNQLSVIYHTPVQFDEPVTGSGLAGLVTSQALAVAVGTLSTNMAAADVNLSNNVVQLQMDALATLTNLTITVGTNTSFTKTGRTGALVIAPGSDASTWSSNPATTNIDAANHELLNVAGISVTGRLAIGFGLFASTNDVAAPASSNTWIVYAATVSGTNYLLGVDWQTNRTWIGEHP